MSGDKKSIGFYNFNQYKLVCGGHYHNSKTIGGKLLWLLQLK